MKITQIGERQNHIRWVLDEVQEQATVVRPQEPHQANVGIPGYLPAYNKYSALKVPKREIFNRSDFPDFYTIKYLRVGDFGVKIKNL